MVLLNGFLKKLRLFIIFKEKYYLFVFIKNGDLIKKIIYDFFVEKMLVECDGIL